MSMVVAKLVEASPTTHLAHNQREKGSERETFISRLSPLARDIFHTLWDLVAVAGSLCYAIEISSNVHVGQA